MSGVLGHRGVREAIGTTVWVVSATSLFLFANFRGSAWRESLAEVFGKDPLNIFLALLVPFVVLSELIGFTLQSTINPALGLAFAVAGKSDAWQFIQTVLPGMIVGHAVGVQILTRITPASLLAKGLLSPPAPRGLTRIGAILAEALLTFGLTFGCLMASCIRRPQIRVTLVAIWIGSLIAMGAEATGAVMNPLMAIALAAHARDFQHSLVYAVGPLSGAVLGGLGFRAFQQVRGIGKKRRMVPRKKKSG